MKEAVQTTLIFLLLLVLSRYIKIFEVASSSMEPAVSTGSLVFSVGTKTLKLSDIVVYKIPQNSVPITHRIIKILNIHNKTFYITKGDNNKVEDPYPITQDEIIGKVDLIIPHIASIFRRLFSYKLISLTFYAPVGFIIGSIFRKLII